MGSNCQLKSLLTVNGPTINENTVPNEERVQNDDVKKGAEQNDELDEKGVEEANDTKWLGNYKYKLRPDNISDIEQKIVTKVSLSLDG